MSRLLIAIPARVRSAAGLAFAAVFTVAAALAVPGAVWAQTLTWTGATNGAWDTTTANWGGTASVFSNGATVTFDDTASGTTGVTTAAAVSPAGTVTINNATKTYALSGSGGLSGTLNLTKLGTGALTLSNSNAFTGTTTLRGGTTTLAGSGVVAATGVGFTAIASSAGDSATLVVKDSARLTTNGNFYVGNLAGANGTVLMQSGTLEHVGGFFRVGSDGNGTLNQSGGLITLTAAGVLPTVGRFSTSTSSMTISSGTFQLTGSNSVLQVGAAGSGSLTVSGNGLVDTGTSSGTTLRIVAQIAQGTGVVNLDGGTIRTRQVDTTGTGAASSTFNFNGGTLVALTSNASYLQGLTAANVRGGGARIDTNGNPITIAQRLLDGGGGGGLTKLGAGTLTLSASNTYTGTTTISGGVLSANQSNALGAGGSITLAGGTLQYTAASAGQDWASRFKNSAAAIALDTNGQNISLAGAIDNTNVGGLTKLSSGTLTLTGNNTYTGATTVNGGALVLGGNGALTSNLIVGDPAGSAGTVFITGGTVAVSGGFFRIGVSGSGTLNQSGGLVTFSNAAALPTIGRLAGSTGQMTVSSGTFRLTNSNSAIQVGADLGSNGTLTVSGNGLIDTGTSSGNVLRIIALNGQGTGVVNLDGGTIRTQQVDTTGTGAASSTFNFNGGTLVALSSNATFLQGLTAANVKAGGALIDTNGNTITIAQTLLDSGTGSLAKLGAGVLTLTGNNTYLGSTTISTGTLSVGNGGSSGSLAGNIVNNATVVFHRSNDSTYAGGISGAGVVTKLGAGSLALAGTFANTGRLSTGPGAGTVAITGSAGFTNAGGGATLSTGGGTVLVESGGTLSFAGGWNNVEDATLTVKGTLLSDGDINLGDFGASRTLATLNVSGTAAQSSGGLFVGTKNNAYTVVNQTAGSSQFGAVAIGGYSAQQLGVVNLSGGVLGAGAVTMTSTGANAVVMNLNGGTLALSSLTNNVAGSGANAVNFNGGTLQAQGTLTLPSTLQVFVNSGSATTIDTNGNAVTISAPILAASGNGVVSIPITSAGSGYLQAPGVVLSGGGGSGATAVATVTNGTISGITITNPGRGYTSAPTATLVGDATALGYSSVATLGSGVLGANVATGGLTKLGAGSLTLAGTSTYTGQTLVSAGSLVVDGSLTGGVAVAAGGTLAGSGSVGGVLSGAGLVAPGNSPGILTASSVDPTSSMAFAFELTGTAPAYGSPTNSVNDVLWLTGGTPFTQSLTSANAVSLYLTPAAADAGTVTGGFFTAGQVDFLTGIQGAAFSYFVQDPAGTFSYGGQTYKTLSQYDPAKSVTISTVAANGGQVMQLVVVPEPGAVVLAGMGAAVGVWMVRRRKA